MYVVFTVCSKINRNLIRNLIITPRFSPPLCKYYEDKFSRITVHPLQYGVSKMAIKRFYTVDADNVHKKDWYSEEEYEELKKKRDAHWKRMKITLIILTSLFSICSVYLIYALGSPKTDDEGNTVEDEFSALPLPIQFLKRMFREIEYFKKTIRQPASNKLLPDPPMAPYHQPQYTLVLEMSDLLIHADWTYQTGWRFKKRPGVEKFLELVTIPLFELVVFTGEGSSTIPILDALDPNGYIMHKLTRESTEFVEGHYVKNLDYLNRDLNRVVVVDWNKNSVKFHRDNTLIIPRWGGEDDDTALVDLAVFLRAIAASGVDDVREILSYYEKYDNPVEEFRESQRRLLEQIEEDEERERNKQVNLASRWASTFLKPQRKSDKF